MLHAVIVLIFAITALAANSPATFEADSAGNLDVTVTDSFNVHASAMVLDGFLTVGTGVSVINVSTVAELQEAWQSLQGQPMSSPITIQLAPSIYDLSSIGGILVFMKQPFGGFITLQGTVGNTSAVVIEGEVDFAAVQDLTVQWITFSNSFGFSNVIILYSGARVNFNNVLVQNGYYGIQMIGDNAPSYLKMIGRTSLYMTNSVINTLTFGLTSSSSEWTLNNVNVTLSNPSVALDAASFSYGNCLNCNINGGNNQQGLGVAVTQSSSILMWNGIISTIGTAFSANGAGSFIILGSSSLMISNVYLGFSVTRGAAIDTQGLSVATCALSSDCSSRASITNGFFDGFYTTGCTLTTGTSTGC